MIYQDVMDLLPTFWNPMNYEERYCNIPLTDPYSSEYINVHALLQGNYFSISTGIYRVQNPLLWAKFVLKKKEYEKRGLVQIKSIFHDTCTVNIDPICRFNLDWRMGERFMFGPGVYFSVHPDIAFKHSSKRNGSFRAMFVFDVLVQNVQRGYKNIFLPDPGYDTVLAHADQTYVKYFDCEYYPRYFMTYQIRSNYIDLPADSDSSDIIIID